MTLQILGGSTSQTVDFFIQDTSKTNGDGLTGLVHNTSGLVAYYKKGATGLAVQITLASQTEGGAWTSGGFVAVTNMPGVYRLDIPNAALDSEVQTIIQLRGAANMAQVTLRVMGGKVQSNAVTVADKSGYSLTQAFPANFASLGINSSGHVSRVTLVDTTTANSDMRGTDNAALASNWTSTRAGYLDGVLLAANYNQRTVQVTGSNHVAADIHELQPQVITAADFAPGAIDANALAADGVAEIQSGLATSENQTILIDGVGYITSVLMGAISDAGTAAETYQIAFGGATYTVDYSGLDATGNRSTTTRTKT